VIRAVFLDAGGVFHFPNEEGVRQALAEVGFELPPGALLRAHHTAMRRLDEVGRAHVEGDWSRAYVDGLAAGLGVPESVLEDALTGLRAFFARPGSWSGVIADSVAALPELAATGVRLAVVSNADGTVEARLRDEGIVQVGDGVGTRVDIVVDSAVVGVAKPDPRIFEPALAATGVRPDEAVHVGDSVLADVGGARAAGITPLHLDPFALCEDGDHDHVRSLHEVAARVRLQRHER
jgi:putative hydrolase of the HAD superfamily